MNRRPRHDRLLNWLAAHYTVALWFLLTGDLIYAVGISPLDEPARDAISAVILLFGGYEVILDQINNRLLSRSNANLRRKSEADAQEKTKLRREVEDVNKKYAEAAKKAEAANQENAELRRRIAELEQQRNGNGNGNGNGAK